MRDDKQNHDRRTSYRCAVVDARERCALQVGSELLPARLVDESAGGFAVVVDRLAGLGVDQSAQLHTDNGWFSVRVVNVTEVEATEDDVATSDEHGSWFRLGLSRVGEATLADPPTVSLLAGSLRFRPSHSHRSSEMPMLAGILMAAAVVAVPAVLIGVLWYAWQSGAKWRAQSADPMAAQVTPSEWPRAALSADGRSAFGPDSSSTREPTPSSTLSGFELSETIRRLPSATALELPEVAKLLRLTADQRAKITRLIEAAFQAMREWDKTLAGQQRQQISERRTQLLDETGREALGLLTKEQRARWDELIGTRPPEAKAPGK